MTRSASPELQVNEPIIYADAGERIARGIEGTSAASITANPEVLHQIASEAGFTGLVSCAIIIDDEEQQGLALDILNSSADNGQHSKRISIDIEPTTEQEAAVFIQDALIKGANQLAHEIPGIKPKTADSILDKDETGRFINERTVYFGSGFTAMAGSIAVLEVVAAQSPSTVRGISAAIIAVATAIKTQDAYIDAKVNDGKIRGYQPFISFKDK